MRVLILSILCLASSMHAGKDKAAKRAAKEAKYAPSAAERADEARLAALYAANAATSQHAINCPGPANGGCFQCNAQGLKGQGESDKK